MPFWTLRLPAAMALLAAMTTPRPQDASSGAVALAERTLREELELDEEAPVHLESVEAVDWPDSSLGCPEPGVAYLTALVPGHRVVLETAGRSYEVHVGSGRAVVCRDSDRRFRRDRKPLPERVPGSRDAEGELVELPDALRRAIVEDLAARLEVDSGTITLAEARKLVWSDGSLGCPEPGVTYTQAPVEGYRVTLRQGEKTYDYRAAASGTFRLCERRLPARRNPRPGER